MSMSLYVWSTPVITDADEAARLLNLEDESVFEPENARGTGSQTEGGVTWITNQQLYGVVHPAP